MNIIYSEYLDTNFEVETTFIQGKCGVLTLIPHDALQDIFFNKMPAKKPEITVEYSSRNLSVSERHPVFECEIKDSTGRRIVEIGEASEASLTDDIAKMYPYTLAYQRAFDRAVIRYLQLPGKYYSNMEITDGITIDAVDEDSDELVKEETQVFEQSEIVVEKAPITASETVDVSETPAIEKAPIATTEYGSTIIKIGKYNGKNKTVAEIYAEDQSWFNYIVNNMTNVKESVKIQVDAMKAYASTQN